MVLYMHCMYVTSFVMWWCSLLVVLFFVSYLSCLLKHFWWWEVMLFSPTLWSNSDVGGVLLFFPHILKQFWCWGCSPVPMGQLCWDVIVYCNAINLSEKQVWEDFFCSHILKQFWCWNCIFPSYLEAILMLGCSAVLLGQLCSDITVFVGFHVINLSRDKQLWKSFFVLTSWSNSDVGIVFFTHILKQFFWGCSAVPLGQLCAVVIIVFCGCHTIHLVTEKQVWEVFLSPSHLEANLRWGLYFPLIFSKSDFGTVYFPHILKQFWCLGGSAVPLGQLCQM